MLKALKCTFGGEVLELCHSGVVWEGVDFAVPCEDLDALCLETAPKARLMFYTVMIS